MVSTARRTPFGEPPRADAEAAAWIARLNSDARSATTDDALRAWLQADPEHEAAFERATEIWAMIPGAVRLSEAEAPRPVPRPNMRQQHWGMALAASLLIALGAGGWWMSDRAIDYSTEIGEQRVATLKDGSRIALNTGTELHVDFDDKVRRVTLDRGEAMFEVAPNPDRPFVVTAGDRTVRAVGTAFIVRRSGSSVVVTLIEGKVAVAPLRETPEGAEAPALLTAGERLIATAEAPPLIDQPSMEAATAWRRGQAVFNDTPLANAIAELNRYGGPRIAIGDPRLASLRVSGVFATNDTAEFASAIAALHGLRVQHGQSELRIVR